MFKSYKIQKRYLLMTKDLIVKSNRLIEARQKLTANEQKIIFNLIAQIKTDDEDFKLYRFRVKDLADLMGIKRKDFHKEVRETTRGLMTKVFSVKDKDTDRELQLAWFSSAEYRNGIVELEFSPKLKPFLLQLKEEFTQFTLGNVMRLKSNYSCRIYELLKQYESIKKRRFKVDDLRYKLGISEEEYKLYADFKRFVILKAQKELCKKTDIEFKFTENKVAKGKVESITFCIYPKIEKITNISKNVKQSHQKFIQRDNSQIDFDKYYANLSGKA
jgi:plasmid replication initiation protein